MTRWEIPSPLHIRMARRPMQNERDSSCQAWGNGKAKCFKAILLYKAEQTELHVYIRALYLDNYGIFDVWIYAQGIGPSCTGFP